MNPEESAVPSRLFPLPARFLSLEFCVLGVLLRPIPVPNWFQAPLGSAPRRLCGKCPLLFKSVPHPSPVSFWILDSKFWIRFFMQFRSRPPCSADPNSRTHFPPVKSAVAANVIAHPEGFRYHVSRKRTAHLGHPSRGGLGKPISYVSWLISPLFSLLPFTLRCPLSTVHYPLSIIHCPLSIVPLHPWLTFLPPVHSVNNSRPFA